MIDIKLQRQRLIASKALADAAHESVMATLPPMPVPVGSSPIDQAVSGMFAAMNAANEAQRARLEADHAEVCAEFDKAMALLDAQDTANGAAIDEVADDA